MQDNGKLDVDAVRQRALKISQGEDAATPVENWLRAEDELRAEQAARIAADAAEAGLRQARISALTHP